MRNIVEILGWMGHHTTKRGDPAREAQWGKRLSISGDAKFDHSSLVRSLRKEIANSIYAAAAGDNPFIPVTFHKSPNIVLVVVPDDLQVLAESFQPMTTPKTKSRVGVSEWSEVFVKDVFVESA